jgi:hypothetical protein
MFSVSGGRFLARGRARKPNDVPPGIRSRIAAYCRAALNDGAYPVGRFYPDLLD